MSQAGAPRPLPPEALAEIEQGRLIAAIKIVRQEWSVDLKSAKDAVDSYVASQPALKASLAAKSDQARNRLLLWIILLVLVGVALSIAARG